MTTIDTGVEERKRLYRSQGWARARKAFLAQFPFCRMCGAQAVAVDHIAGHSDPDWRDRFWDRSQWQPLCLNHHNEKSARERAEAGRGSLAGEGHSR